MFTTLKYSIEAPESVKDIAKAFKKKIKERMIWPTTSIKKAKGEKESDINLVFFPIVSRTGTDIDAAVSKMNDIKPTILVALHHNFDPECIVSDSSKLVTRENTLTLDCLFHEDKGLLECNRNVQAYDKAAKWLKQQKKSQKK
ncbi:uncharacterized protein si:dkey-111e8.5 [Xyrauchen texanus]|uniref:uncharacterized protein si:dkey-111e8.5 n=1 Tax=Xyrauchen texanus TaxID=154827 RepID=UPI002242040F|nr:uncharacterized protein si:dkey-111e8.5 [Xyrauchen texanus]XP_051966452.1 uncharacterized protein si:dkey-111e8.5 [Xyrauchen texanus]XP_051966459.1 uncharacterized protein si:dkey-111e8.5 [Xyrauchen texanus]XP_051966467.1 uncharacterized protein si:dkey-111e8.5 [Xyrauchen texanus]